LSIGTILFYFFYKESWDSNYSKSIIDAFFGTFELEIGENVFNYPPLDDNSINSLIMRFVYLFYQVLGTIIIAIGLIEVGVELFKTDFNLEKAVLFRNHTIFIGTGHIGRRSIEYFENILPKDQLIVIDLEKNEDFINIRESKSNFAFIKGDATKGNVLIEGGVKHAKRIIIVTSDDLINLRIAIKSKELNENIRTVLRIYDDEFASRIEEFDEVDATISTSRISAPYFVASAISDLAEVKYAFRTNSSSNPRIVFIGQFKFSYSLISEKSLSVEQLETKNSLIILQINNDFNPDQKILISENDNLLVLGELQEIQRLATDLDPKRKIEIKDTDSHLNKPLILVGLGHVGRRIVETVETLFPTKKIIVIDKKNPSNFTYKRVEKENFKFIPGNAFHELTLLNANIKSADEIILATTEDITNLNIAIKAKKLNPSIRTVLRTYEELFSSKLPDIPEVDKTISSSILSAPYIVTAAISRLKEVKYALLTRVTGKNEENKLLFLAEFNITDVNNVSLAEIEEKFEVVIIQLNDIFRPDLAIKIKRTDDILVFGDKINLVKLAEYLVDPELDLDNLVIPSG
jgi:Trk K+ transport system NAD-binding subunit